MKLKQMLKRDLRLFLRGLVPALLLSVLLALACIIAAVSAESSADRKREPVKLALVDNEDSVLSRIAITTVSSQNYVSSLLSLNVTDEASAMKGMSDGSYSAAVILPDGYMDSIMHGTSCKGKIYISDAVQDDAEVIKAISEFGKKLLAAGQYGVFAGEQFAAATDFYDKYLEDSNSGLINFALGAYDSAFTFEVLPYSDTGVSLLYYYAACWITLMLFVCGLFFPELYINDCKGSIYARLRTVGIGRMHFMSGKLLFPFIFRALLLLPLLFIFNLNAYLYALLAALLISVMTSCICVALSKRGGWVVLILGVCAVCLFMAGGMVPRTMLPGILPKIAQYTPFGCIQSLIIYCFGGDFNKPALLIAVIYSAAAFGACLHFLKTLDTHSEEVRL